MAPDDNSGATPVGLRVTATSKADEVVVPLELSSINGGIKVIKDGDEVTLMFNPTISEEIGAYRRCNVIVKFKEGGSVRVVPTDLK
tara:strand:+ start:294 stop:551 length:258 start_codon:yes stop_codon:yes gene_type:complete